MKIFIANFPFDLSETDICDLFKIFGEITDCRLVRDPVTRRSKGFGFIVFRHKNSAKLAIKQMDGYRFKGRNIAVKASTSETVSPRLKKTG